MESVFCPAVGSGGGMVGGQGSSVQPAAIGGTDASDEVVGGCGY